jgi:FAD/FMN-containing dehydrogenase
MIAEFTGDTPGQARLAAAKCKKLMEEKYRARVHLTKNRKERMKYWIMRRESFNLLRKHSRGMHTAPFIDDIIVHPSQLPEFLPLLDKIFAKYKSLIYTVAGHTGDANFHIIPLMKLSDPKQRQIIPKLAVEVYSLVLKFQGSITAEHNDGLIRTPFLEKMYGSQVVELFAQVKDIFDPQNLFNPGKKVGELPKSWQEYIVKD